MNLPLLVVTGPPVAGKHMVCRTLLACGYNSVIDTGSGVRTELADNGEPAPDRDRQGEFATAKIREFGGGYFMDRLLGHEPAPHIIDGLRRKVEIDHALSLNAVVMYLDAHAADRFAWGAARGTERDVTDQEAFSDRDRREFGQLRVGNGTWYRHSDPYQRDLGYARDHAHVIIHNRTSPETLEYLVQRALRDLMSGKAGPGSGWHPRVYGLDPAMVGSR